MNYFDIKRLLKSKFWTMFLFGLLIATIAFFVTILTLPYYKSSSDFLVVQTSQNNQDFYTQFKSSEYLGKVLGEAVYSESFINAVIGTGKVSGESLPFDKKTRLDQWKKMVIVKKNLELGVIQISVAGDDPKEVNKIMEGISDVLINQNTLFRGGNPDSVQIRILSGPILEKTPTMLTLIKILGTSFVVGFLFSLLYFFGKSEKSTMKLFED
jgi:capsular polysaccharide biosynthesis protein